MKLTPLHLTRIVFLLCLADILFVTNVRALELSLGMSLNQHAVEIRNNDDPSTMAAELQNEFYASPSLSLASDPQYFGQSRFGWFFGVNIGSYEVPSQREADGSSRDYNTRLRGSFGHMNPTIFYRFGDKYLRGIHHWSWMIGAGYGLSFLSVDGTFVTNRQPEALQKRIRVKRTLGFFPLPAIYTKLRIGNWFAGFASCFGGPGLEQDDYTFRLRFRTLNFGYVFEL